MTTRASSLTILPLTRIPAIEPGDDLPRVLIQSARNEQGGFQPGDVLVVAQKIVSKAAGLYVELADVAPSQRAIELGEQIGKDPRFIEVVLRESAEVVAAKPQVLITQHVAGGIMANAGIDRSNVVQQPGEERVLLLPRDPDAAAEQLRAALATATGVADIGVVISDSWGRPWRVGTTGVAIGVAGLAALHDFRGQTDMTGRVLEVAVEAVADELAGAANLVMGQGAEGVPAVIVRGWARKGSTGAARDLLRPRREDLFR